MLINPHRCTLYIQSERVRERPDREREHLADAILCEPRFSVVDYVKQKVPVQQDRPQHSNVGEKEGKKAGERVMEG